MAGVETIWELHTLIGATGKRGNAGTETGTETTKRCGEREPVSWPYSRQEHTRYILQSVNLYQGDIAASSSLNLELLCID